MNAATFDLKDAIKSAKDKGVNYLEIYDELVKYFKETRICWERKNVIYYFVRRPWYVFFFLYKDEKLDGMGKYKAEFFESIVRTSIKNIRNILMIPLFEKHIPALLFAAKSISITRYDEIREELLDLGIHC